MIAFLLTCMSCGNREGISGLPCSTLLVSMFDDFSVDAKTIFTLGIDGLIFSPLRRSIRDCYNREKLKWRRGSYKKGQRPPVKKVTFFLPFFFSPLARPRVQKIKNQETRFSRLLLGLICKWKGGFWHPLLWALGTIGLKRSVLAACNISFLKHSLNYIEECKSTFLSLMGFIEKFSD